MFDLAGLPGVISERITGLEWKHENIGMSGSSILVFEKMVLKIEKTGRSSEHEKTLLAWLENKLPVPKIIETTDSDGYSFLLMSKLDGDMACSRNSLLNIEDTVKALAHGLKMLWQIDIAGCPFNNSLPEKIIQAKFNIENNLVDINDFNPETFTTEGFSDVNDLFDFLDQNRPAEDPVFSHGDFCLPNIFVSGNKTTGFLDWGGGGIADRFQDIALCLRSFKLNYLLSGRDINEFSGYRELLLRELDIEPDEKKIRYFILLDELF